MEYFRDKNGTLTNCEHKYVYKGTNSYYRFTGRFSKEYVLVDIYFCERCLEEEEKKKRIEINDGEEYKLPDWARTITNRAKAADYS